MNDKILAVFQGQIDYKFKNPDLLLQAFTRRSYSKENGGENNEVLEFIGDKILDFIVVKLLTQKYGFYSKDYDDFNLYEDYNEFVCEFNEGKLTEIKKKLVCREMLASRIRIFGFHYELIMGKSDIKKNIFEQESVQEDLFEAIIGAVALDCNWNLEVLTNVIELMLEPEYYLQNGFDDEENYVVLLQQWYQKKYHKIPVYVFRNTGGFPVGGKQGKYKCELGLYPLIDAFWDVKDTKSEARMAVARKAYEYLEENDLLFDWVDEVGEPEIDRAINQLQELYQKGYLGEPSYRFIETHDDDGNPIWKCECYVRGYNKFWYGYFSSKKAGKKRVAYDMLCDIMDWEDNDEA